MKSPQSEASPSPQVHSANIQRELSQLIDHLEADTRRVKDQRFRGLLDKSAEVLKGLRTLFERFGSGDQASGNKSAPEVRAAKGGARTPPASGKQQENKKSAKSGRGEASNRSTDKKNSKANGDARPAKPGEGGQENATGAQSPEQETPVKPEPAAAMPK